MLQGSPRASSSRLHGRAWLTTGVCLAVVAVCGLAAQAPAGGASATASAPLIAPTAHLPIPATASSAWIVPDPKAPVPAAWTKLGQAAQAIDDGDPATALRLIDTTALAASPLAAHAWFHRGRALARLARYDEALDAYDEARGLAKGAALAQDVAVQTALVHETQGRPGNALRALQHALDVGTRSRDEVLADATRMAMAAGEGDTASSLARRLYYEHPTSERVGDVRAIVNDARVQLDPARVSEVFKLDLARGEQLFAARAYGAAREQFAAIQGLASGDSRELVDLRLAECDYFQKQYRAAIDRLAPYLDEASRRAEARYFHLSSLRGLGRHGEYETRARQLVADFPDSTWSEDALNNLATHYILVDDDEAALAVFAEVVERFPRGKHAERAGWKLGWAAYREKRDADAVEIFERAVQHAPRSDYRPAWIYWAGRAHERLGHKTLALQRYEVAAYDYLNSYYGRLAARRLTAAGRVPGRLTAPLAAPAPVTVAFVTIPDATQARIRALLAASLVDDAYAEILHTQRTVGTSPLLDATYAWALNRQGELRRGITVMKRAYPQYLTADGERIADELQRVIFPVEYWSLIRKYSTQRELDPFMVAALISQESTFQADAKSAANAWGLMQVLPSTGRRLARAERIRFTTARLTDPEVNVRLGTRYFSGLIERFGGAHFALASYNAGESRVVRWQREKPGVEREEFIDDIPFPETQNYVKKILGTVDDYRRLYASTHATSDAAHTARPVAKTPAKAAPVKKTPATKKPAPRRGARG